MSYLFAARRTNRLYFRVATLLKIITYFSVMIYCEISSGAYGEGEGLAHERLTVREVNPSTIGREGASVGAEIKKNI